jgi:hypothetical protein
MAASAEVWIGRVGSSIVGLQDPSSRALATSQIASGVSMWVMKSSASEILNSFANKSGSDRIRNQGISFLLPFDFCGPTPKAQGKIRHIYGTDTDGNSTSGRDVCHTSAI